MGVIEAPLVSHHAYRSQRRFVAKERTFERINKLEQENAKLRWSLERTVMELQVWQKWWHASDVASSNFTVESDDFVQGGVYSKQKDDVVEADGFIEKGVYSNQDGVFVNNASFVKMDVYGKKQKNDFVDVDVSVEEGIYSKRKGELVKKSGFVEKGVYSKHEVDFVQAGGLVKNIEKNDSVEVDGFLEKGVYRKHKGGLVEKNGFVLKGRDNKQKGNLVQKDGLVKDTVKEDLVKDCRTQDGRRVWRGSVSKKNANGVT